MFILCRCFLFSSNKFTWQAAQTFCNRNTFGGKKWIPLELPENGEADARFVSNTIASFTCKFILCVYVYVCMCVAQGSYDIGMNIY